MKPAWYLDWRKERCVIVASGPSAVDVPILLAAGQVKVVVINSSWNLAPWADVLYACDAQWWRVHEGVPEFSGLKVGNTTEEALIRGVNGVRVAQKPRASQDEMVFNSPGVVAGGGSSGFQALNLVAQFGCRDIALVGYDASLGWGSHWHGDHGNGLKNPLEETVAIWRESMDRAGPVLLSRGIKVVNCSSRSALTGYPKIDFEDWLKCSK